MAGSRAYHVPHPYLFVLLTAPLFRLPDCLVARAPLIATVSRTAWRNIRLFFFPPSFLLLFLFVSPFVVESIVVRVAPDATPAGGQYDLVLLLKVPCAVAQSWAHDNYGDAQHSCIGLSRAT